MLLQVLLMLSIAHGGKEHKNLQVIQGDHKAIDKGMQAFTKGLGVKCRTCHVKGEHALDDVPAKLAARKFLDAVVGESDSANKKAALASLLAELKLKAPKDEAVIWSAVSGFERKPK